MSNIEELKSVLTEALDEKGVLNEIKSKLRAEIFNVLEDNSFEKPKTSQENLLINELIREYLEFNHYKYTKSVFSRESNLSREPLNRDIIAAELHVKEDKTTKQVPLIYSLLWHFLNHEETDEHENQTLLHNYRVNNASGKQSRTHRSPDKSAKDSRKIHIYKYNDQLD